jgi:lauroyl/myristoyl acyltransferase
VTILSRVSEQLTVAGYGAGWKALRVAPEPAVRWAFERAADAATHRNGRGVQQLRRNLARVLANNTDQAPSLEQAESLEHAVRDGMRSYARYWMETFRLPAMDVHAILGRTHTDGIEGLDESLHSKHGTILALPHSGNWEVAGLWLVNRGFPFTTVAERLKPESLYDKFVAYRESLGMTVLPLTGGTVSATRLMLQRLRSGGVVCLVADRDLSQRGVEVDFFGEPTRMPAGPAQLALATGASLIPVHTYYDGDGWGQWCGDPVRFTDVDKGDADESSAAQSSAAQSGAAQNSKVKAATQALADAFAGRIAQHPSDWHMLQRLWLADL